ncbi:hypothetical protein B7494_g267 [Chlorociboria aeruginascens]|nr:hypothetical protein B7494_g267 [Chlorociboria aeruginascens]
MSSQSTRSIRISDIPLAISTAQLLATCCWLINSSNSISLGDEIKVSLAPQFGAQFGTVTFSTQNDKVKALAQKSRIGGWGACDDVFHGITVLHSPINTDGGPDLDIVAVHGLNGNAMDTWTHVDNVQSVMWLRDLLPLTPPFGSARIMTFGYNSRWADKKSSSGLGGLRAKAIVDPLRPHNPISATANEDFGNMKHVPHYECIYETEYMTVGGMAKHALGMTSVDARHYPLPPGRKWYEGKGLRTKNEEKNLSGRQEEIEFLGDLVVKCQQSGASAVAVTGIGGIGDKVSLEEAYFHISRRLGHDILLPNDRSALTLEIWNSLSPPRKLRIFKDWLQQPENLQTIFILDDLDGLHDTDLILSIISREAQMILFSSRNPILQQDIHRMTHNLGLSLMVPSEIVQLMEMVLARIGYESEEGERLDRDVLLDIARELDGLPLAAIIAIRYITTVISQSESESPERDFLDVLQGPDFETRRRFLEYRPGGGGTNLMDTFLVSKSRLRDPDGLAWRLMQFVACLETNPALTHFRRFFYHRERFAVMEKYGIDIFPDRDLLAADDTAISEVFAECETVSFGEKVAKAKGGTRFHPLWKECALHVMGEEGRVRVLSQVMILAAFKIVVGANEVEKGKGKDEKANEHENRDWDVKTTRRFNSYIVVNIPQNLSRTYQDRVFELSYNPINSKSSLLAG